MQLNPTSALSRAQAALCVLAVTLALAVAPGLLTSARASGERHAAAAASSCASAQAALAQARHRQSAAKAKVAKAKKAVAKAKHAHKPAKVRKAKKALAKAKKQYAAAHRAVQARASQQRSACARPAGSGNPSTGTGQKLSLLGLAQGLTLGPIDLGQLTTLLDQLLPGVTDQLDPSQLSALLAGFNGGPDLDAAEVLALLGSGFDVSDVTAILTGTASPELLTALIGSVVDQLGGLSGLPVPGGAFDPTSLFEIFAGMFGGLDPSQLGALLGMLTAAFGAAGSPLDAGQLTDMLDSLVPGVSGDFDPSDLTSMLGALNGGGLSAATLSNLLGGQFSAAQLQQVLAGTASPELLASVVSQVIAQLSAAGGGGFALPGTLDASTITDLISTVTDLFGALTGGGGVLPVVCGLIPIPGLCP